ncbi:MAG: GDSL-type esterase/lipase family protein [Mucilaginibacter sp.]
MWILEIGTRKGLLVMLLLISSLNIFAQTQDVNIVYIGDSITQGVQLNDPATDAPPARATAYLRSQEGIGTVAFSNNGVSGFTTVDFLPSTNTVFNKAEAAASAFADKQAMLIFFIMLGTNDSAIQGPNGSPVSADQYHNNLKTIIDRLLQDFPNCKVIIQLPIWYSPNTYNGSKYLQEGLTRLQSYFPQINKLVSEYTSINPKQVFESDQKAFNYFSKHYLTDLIPEPGKQGTFYLHPNKKGTEALGVFWGTTIYKTIKKIKG